jgi:hypothetical protein
MYQQIKKHTDTVMERLVRKIKKKEGQSLYKW